MTNDKVQSGAGALEFTGERYQPEVDGPIAFEHLHRYHFAATHAAGKTVLDVACGEGYGTDILSSVAEAATGLDVSRDAVAHARSRYGRANLSFVNGSAAELPFADHSFDLVVSFETIEHHDRHQEMISEIHRVLRPGGLLIISSPNKQYYSVEPGYQNPFHVKELFREELLELLSSAFRHVQLHGQRVVYGSILIPADHAEFQSLRPAVAGEPVQVSAGLAKPQYDVVIASDGTLPSPVASIFEMDVHGLDPATFYAVHLPERVASADAELATLRDLHEQLSQELQANRDARTRALEELVAEKEVRLQAAAEGKRQQDSWLAELQLHAKNLEARRGELESQLSASIAHATVLKSQLSEQGARLGDVERVRDSLLSDLDGLVRMQTGAQERADALAEELVQRDQRLQVLEKEVRGQEARVRALDDQLVERDGRLEVLAQQMLECETQLRGLAIELAERDARLDALAGDLTERESRMREMAGALAERDELLRALATERAERDAYIQSLSAELSERDSILASRTQQITDLEKRLQEAEQLLGQEREHLHDSRVRAQFLEEQMRRIMGSRSWRYTAMFRRNPK